jgi:hypothetical protein
MIRTRYSKTDHNLLSMRPATRLTCVWLPTNDPRSPLTRVWQHARTDKPAPLSSIPEESEGGKRCA